MADNYTRSRSTAHPNLGGTVFNQTTNRHATVLKAKIRPPKRTE
jgi:hypothetical protein